MKRDEVKNIFPDATDDQINSVLNLYGTSVGALRGQLTTITDELTTLKGKGDIDALITDRDSWKAKAEGYEAEAAKAARETELKGRFATAHGGKKFVNSYTEEGLLGAFKSEIEKPENQGKSDADIYGEITKDRTDLYANERRASDIPGVGRAEPPTNAESYIAEKYQKNPFYKG